MDTHSNAHRHYQPVAGTSQRPQSASKQNGVGGEAAVSKGPKRKRLAKACDPCHKSKRRCDGTAPCSNCYFASKTCTYTDASGRPVPAPRNVPAELKAPVGTPEPSLAAGSHAHQIGAASPSSQFTLDGSEDDQSKPRKRIRIDRDHAGLPPDSIPRNPAPPGNLTANRALGLDPALTRELVNLFFTHRHPQRMIIHKPSFSAALSHNRVPAYLLLAVCALAAPLSKQTRIRTNPVRIAGQGFADDARALMFDKSGRMVCEPNLATAQALCLLQMHESLARPSWTSSYHAMALQVLDGLGLHKPDPPSTTLVPSPEFVHDVIERECMRRVFWLIHLLDLISSIYFKIRAAPKGEELRLPADETSFELATHSALPEYLHTPAPRTQSASEIGHFIRILNIYDRVENMLEGPEGRPMGDSRAWIGESEQEITVWMASLTDNLRFSQESLQIQLSMLETSSNTGAWSFCCMHVIHASCIIALSHARQYDQGEKFEAPEWAVARLELVVTSIGSRVKNSMILGCVLWPLLKYCHMDDPQVRAWAADYEEQWGVRVRDCIRMVDKRAQPLVPQSQPTQRPLPDYSLYGSQRGPGPDFSRPSHDTRTQPYLHKTIDATPFSDARADPPPGSRHQTTGDGSLPSLKSSGLLDSWNAPTEPPLPSWNNASHGRVETPPSRSSSPRSQYHLLSEPFRGSGPSSLPVGMPWLANETISSSLKP